jgi:hypothetical protein
VEAISIPLRSIEKPHLRRSPSKMKKRKVIRFLQWSALSLAVIAVATYAIADAGAKTP